MKRGVAERIIQFVLLHPLFMSHAYRKSHGIPFLLVTIKITVKMSPMTVQYPLFVNVMLCFLLTFILNDF